MNDTQRLWFRLVFWSAAALVLSVVAIGSTIGRVSRGGDWNQNTVIIAVLGAVVFIISAITLPWSYGRFNRSR